MHAFGPSVGVAAVIAGALAMGVAPTAHAAPGNPSTVRTG